MRFVAIGLLCLLMSFPAWGVHRLDEEIGAELDADMTTTGMIKTARRGTDRWKEELLNQYGKLEDLLPKEGKERLRLAQEAWFAWIGEEMNLQNVLYDAIYNNLDGGTMWLVTGAIADMEVVRARALDLSDYRGAMKSGDFFPDFYPDVGSNEARLASEAVIGGYGLFQEVPCLEEKARHALEAWFQFREAELDFQAWFYGWRDTGGFRSHCGLLLDGEQARRLETLWRDLFAGGVVVSGPIESGGGRLLRPKEGGCDFFALLITTEAMILRDRPWGEVALSLPVVPGDTRRLLVRVKGHRKGWLSVEFPDGERGWTFWKYLVLPFGKEDLDGKIALRNGPSFESAVRYETFGGGEGHVLGGQGAWALVRHDRDGGTVVGWLDCSLRETHPSDSGP